MNESQALSKNQLIEDALKEAKHLRFGAKIFLMNGVKLESGLVDYDDDHLLITDPFGGFTLVRRDAVSSFVTTDDQVNLPIFKRTSDTLEEDYLRTCQQDNRLRIYLINGICLKGYIAGTDDASVILMSTLADKSADHIVFKSSIATIAQDAILQ